MELIADLSAREHVTARASLPAGSPASLSAEFAYVAQASRRNDRVGLCGLCGRCGRCALAASLRLARLVCEEQRPGKDRGDGTEQHDSHSRLRSLFSHEIHGRFFRTAMSYLRVVSQQSGHCDWEYAVPIGSALGLTISRRVALGSRFACRGRETRFDHLGKD
jgi:hypothetical protein